MKLSFSQFATAFAVLAGTSLISPTAEAFSTGAGGCIGGQAAPVGHGVPSSGTVEDAGLTVTAVATDTPGEYTVSLSGGGEFKGYLFRAAGASTIVDMGTGQEAAACEAEDAVGVTHTSSDPKTEVMATFAAPEGATSAVMDVSVVVNVTTFYYTGLTVDLAAAEAPEPAPTDPEETTTTEAPTPAEADATEAPAPTEPEATDPPSAAAAWKSAQVLGLVGAAVAAMALF